MLLPQLPELHRHPNSLPGTLDDVQIAEVVQSIASTKVLNSC